MESKGTGDVVALRPLVVAATPRAPAVYPGHHNSPQRRDHCCREAGGADKQQLEHARLQPPGARCWSDARSKRWAPPSRPHFSAMFRSAAPFPSRTVSPSACHRRDDRYAHLLSLPVSSFLALQLSSLPTTPLPTTSSASTPIFASVVQLLQLLYATPYKTP